jgi:hypothetical protein
MTVNSASKPDSYPIPKTEDLLSTLSGGQTFSKLDLSHTYLQLVLDDESKPYMTINTHRGLYQYTQLPFGVSASPAIFQRTIEGVLRGAKLAKARMDDILLSGRTDEEHVKVLEDVLRRVQEAGLKLRLDKCVFQAPSVDWVGHRIDSEGVHPIPEKLEAVQEVPVPKNVSELKSFLGLVNYYGKYIPSLSSTLEPLHRLLRKDAEWIWHKEQEVAFTTVKAQLVSDHVLVHYDVSKPLLLACDASPYGVGAVLAHKFPDGSERPIGYASRSLNSAKTQLRSN